MLSYQLTLLVFILLEADRLAETWQTLRLA